MLVMVFFVGLGWPILNPKLLDEALDQALRGLRRCGYSSAHSWATYR